MDLTPEQLAFCVKRHVTIDFVEYNGGIDARAMYTHDFREYGMSMPTCEIGPAAAVSMAIQRLVDYESQIEKATV